MRKWPTIMLGAFILPVGFMPAALADNAPAPAVTATQPETTPTATTPTETTPAETTPPPQPTTNTPSPPANPTDTATPTPPATTTKEPPGDGDGSYLSGQFLRQPGSGKPGTVILITSKTPCVDDDGKVGRQVQVVLVNEAEVDSDDPPAVNKFISADASGAWTTTVKVPATAKAGERYFVLAACFADGPIDEDTEPFLVYDLQTFTVTKGGKAPVANPVPGKPNYTG